MIKGVVLDIDGVILGTKQGVNFPDPHPDVIESLKQLQAKGIPVSLCSAKPTFSMEKVIKDTHLHNLHIGNNGATIFDIANNVTKIYEIPNNVVVKAIKTALAQNIYIEVFSQEHCFIQKESESDITKILADVRKAYPKVTADLAEAVKDEKIIRFSMVATEDKKEDIEKIAEDFSNDLSMHWSTTPVLKEWIGVFTLKGISKRSGVKEISDSLKIPLSEILAVGDGINDWNFMEVCGYAASMGNGHQELKDLVQTKGKNGYIGPDVDDNGIIEIFKHFGLL